MDTRLNITKGNNSAKNVGGVMVVNLLKLSGHALYFYWSCFIFLPSFV